MPERRKGARSNVVFIATSSLEQHGYDHVEHRTRHPTQTPNGHLDTFRCSCRRPRVKTPGERRNPLARSLMRRGQAAERSSADSLSCSVNSPSCSVTSPLIKEWEI